MAVQKFYIQSLENFLIYLTYIYVKLSRFSGPVQKGILEIIFLSKFRNCLSFRNKFL